MRFKLYEKLREILCVQNSPFRFYPNECTEHRLPLNSEFPLATIRSQLLLSASREQQTSSRPTAPLVTHTWTFYYRPCLNFHFVFSISLLCQGGRTRRCCQCWLECQMAIRVVRIRTRPSWLPQGERGVIGKPHTPFGQPSLPGASFSPRHCSVS